MGSEYSELKVNKSPRVDRVVRKLNALAPEEWKYVYDGEKGIYTPVYKAYNDSFKEIIVQKTKIETDFKMFHDTGIYERYMLNSAQFSAAKNKAETEMLQSLVFDDKGIKRGYSAFKKRAAEVTDIFQETWLRTEYDTAGRQAVAGELFRSYRADADIFPYWKYLETTSSHPREEHLLLVGKTFKIGDPEGDMCFPPNGFNCGCGSEQVDEPDEVSNGKAALEDVDPQFRFNPADQGILPKESHSYFEVMKSANLGNAELFNLPKVPQRERLKAKGLHLVVSQFQEWKDSYHVSGNDIIFQNDYTMANVVFGQEALGVIKNHVGGIENLPDTIQNPDEIWSLWCDKKQLVTKRAYIKDGYIVLTTGGVVKDAFSGDVNLYRKGVLL